METIAWESSDQPKSAGSRLSMILIVKLLIVLNLYSYLSTLT